MRQLFFKFVVVLCCAVGISSTYAAEFYISPGGSNGNNGSQGSPWGTFDYAIDQINPGDTLFVRGGILLPTAIGQ